MWIVIVERGDVRVEFACDDKDKAEGLVSAFIWCGYVAALGHRE